MDRLLEEGLTDRRWREVFLLTVSMLPRGEIMRFLVHVRIALDDLLVDDEALQKLLIWAEDKTRASNILGRQRSAVRLGYIFLTDIWAGAHARTFARTINRDLARARARAHHFARILDLAQKHDHDLDMAEAFERDIELNRTFDYDLARVRVRALANALGINVAADYALLYAWQMAGILASADSFECTEKNVSPYIQYFSHVANLCEQLPDKSLAQAMEGLPLRAPVINQVYWRSFADMLLTLMQKHRNFIYNWRISWQQVENFDAYLAANELLVRCLNLAVVPNRREIEASLLLPPGEWSPTEE